MADNGSIRLVGWRGEEISHATSLDFEGDIRAFLADYFRG